LATSSLGIDRRFRFQEFSFEREESPADDFGEIAERWKDWKAFEGHTVAEKYAQGRIALICDIHVSFTGRNVRSATVSNSPFCDGECFASLVYVADIPNVLQLQMGNDEPMLVLNVETVKLEDGVSVPSLVGLYRIHDVVDHPFGGLTFQSFRDGSFKIIPCLVRRELYILRSLASEGEFNVAQCKVEGAPEIMDHIADDAHKIRGQSLTRDEFERIIAGIRFTLHADNVSVIADEFQEAKVELLDVLTGPLDL
jgi:hypothetical protein